MRRSNAARWTFPSRAIRLAFAVALGAAPATGALAACSAAGDSTGGAQGGAHAGGQGGGSAGGASGAGGAGTGGSSGGLIDGGGGGAGGSSGGDGGSHLCKSVDVLFVIDDSASMGDNQQSLIQSFPGFVAAMRQQLASAESYHVGIVTSDDYYSNDPACQKIGDLVTQTGGIESSAAVCGPFASGHRYLDGKDPDLAARFACAAKVGVGGSDDERMARAMLDAVDPARNAPGQCNDGFARPDSLLVLVLITDEDDVADGCDGSGTCMTYGSGGKPADWYADIVAKRGGIAGNVVVLSLLGKSGNSCGAQISSALLGFTLRFDNSYVGDVCASSYDQFFAAALPTLDDACLHYVPVK